ncbi:globin-like [Antedon mediterranea]|uniref:globin-like n=1 Tax=Antedon mediterranea TaxID=105859 RepID=UPI003AF4A921
MGCTSSVEKGRNSNTPFNDTPIKQAPVDKRLPFTARDKFSLQKSWKAVQRNLNEVGSDAFLRLFKIEPEYQDLFKDLKGQSRDQLMASLAFENQAAIMMNIFDELLEKLDDVDSMSKMLRETGGNHAKYGVTVDMITKFEEPLVKSIRDFLGDRYTENIENLYNKFLTFTFEEFCIGLKEAS